jgi:hypothetical protein
VQLIRKAGGVALLAHWFTGKKYFTKEVLDRLFKENRLDGAETVYGVWSKGSIPKKDLDADRMILKKLLLKYNKLEGGGADCHTEGDLKVLSKTKWLGKMTVGLAENIIKKGNVNKFWSSWRESYTIKA